jgi:hypothetical protein
MGGQLDRRGLLLAARGLAFAQADQDAAILTDLLGLEQVVIASYDAEIVAAHALAEQLAGGGAQAVDAVRGRSGATAGRGGGARRRGQPPLETALRRIVAQEREHAEVLSSTLDMLGVRAPVAPAGAEALARARGAAGLARSLDGLASVSAIVAVAVEQENVQISRYQQAVRDLSDARLIALALQAMSAEGQHTVALRGYLTDDVARIVPEAFERGTSGAP